MPHARRVHGFAIGGLAALATVLLAWPAFASRYGTSYSGTVANLPGTDMATLAFDGLPETVGGSGLVVSEKSTPIGSVELLEFALHAEDEEAFVGQQDDACRR